MIEITEEKFKKYINATDGKKSYSFVDCEKSGLTANEFIYIADNINELKEKYGGGR
jgi:hypothetical protein